MFQFLKDRREKKQREAVKNAREYALEDVLTWVEQNPITELEMVLPHSDRTIRFGSAAECEDKSSEFFNRAFYVDATECRDFDSFRRALNSANQGGTTIRITLVDDLPPEDSNIENTAS